MTRLHLLAPSVVALVGLAASIHALVSFDGALSMTDSPFVLDAADPLPAQMRYVRVEGATLVEGSVQEVQVMRSQRSGPATLDHVYYVSRWARGGETFETTTASEPRADSQLLGVYHPAEHTLVAGRSGAQVADFVRNVWLWSAAILAFGLLGVAVALRGERDVNHVSSRSEPFVAGFRTSARTDAVHVLRRTISTGRAVHLLAAAGATFGISLYFAHAQLDLDPHVGASEIFQIAPVFVLPVLLYMALHDRTTLTVRRGTIERRGLLGWPARLAVVAGDECVLRRLTGGRELADTPYSVEIVKEGARFRLARIAGLQDATELAERVNSLLADANRE